MIENDTEHENAVPKGTLQLLCKAHLDTTLRYEVDWECYELKCASGVSAQLCHPYDLW